MFTINDIYWKVNQFHYLLTIFPTVIVDRIIYPNLFSPRVVFIFLLSIVASVLEFHLFTFFLFR